MTHNNGNTNSSDILAEGAAARATPHPALTIERTGNVVTVTDPCGDVGWWVVLPATAAAAFPSIADVVDAQQGTLPAAVAPAPTGVAAGWTRLVDRQQNDPWLPDVVADSETVLPAFLVAGAAGVAARLVTGPVNGDVLAGCGGPAVVAHVTETLLDAAAAAFAAGCPSTVLAGLAPHIDTVRRDARRLAASPATQ